MEVVRPTFPPATYFSNGEWGSGMLNEGKRQEAPVHPNLSSH